MYIFRIITFILFIAIMLGGCSPSIVESAPRDIKILTGGSHTSLYTFIELVDENILRATVFTSFGPLTHDLDTIFDDSILENFVDKFGNTIGGGGAITNWVYAMEERILSQRQLNNIWNLTERVVMGGVSEEFERVAEGHLVYVWAIIDGDMYWSLYFDDINEPSFSLEADGWESSVANKELLNLFYYITDLLPINLRDFRWSGLD